MAIDVDSLIANAAGVTGTTDLLPGPDLSVNKQAEVSQASSIKKATMGGSNYQQAVSRQYGLPLEGANDLERDLQTLNTSELYGKYGDAATQMLIDRSLGSQQVMLDATVQRGLGEATADTFMDVGLGAVNLGAGVAALGASPFDAELAVNIAGTANLINEQATLESGQTYQGRQRIKAARDAISERSNAALMEQDIVNGDGDLMAGLKNIGRNIVDSAVNATDDATTLTTGVSQAAGSFAGVGKLVQGLQALGRGAVPIAVTAPAAIGLSEGGGAYSQIAADIAGRDHETLVTESPRYRELLAEGMSQQDAKTQLANETGQLSAAITAPLAVATGALTGVARFQANPLGAGSVSQALREALGETVEEGIQGGVSQAAQNFAEQQLANENQSLTEGVGRAIGEGAIYGLGMSGVMQAPSVVGNTTRSLLGSAGDALERRASAIETAAVQNTNIGDDAVLAAGNSAAANMAEAATVLQEAATTAPNPELAGAYANQLVQANTFNVEAAANSRLPEELKADVLQSASQTEAIQRVARIVESATDPRTQLTAGLYLHEMLSGMYDVINSDPAARGELAADSQAANIANEYESLFSAITESPAVLSALQTVEAALSRQAEQPPVDLSEARLATPEGQADLQDAITTAQVAPDKSNQQTNNTILEQASRGRINLTPQQTSALNAANTLLVAAKAGEEAAARLRHTDSRADAVRRNVIMENGEKGKSVLQHAQDIAAAAQAGNVNLAAGRLFHLREFAQNQINKVVALNSHLATGNPDSPAVSYQALSPNMEWFDAPQGMFVKPGNKRSVQLAQNIGMEAQLLTDVYNGLAAAYPQLGGAHLDGTPLDSSLNESAQDVVAAYRLNQSKVNAAAVTPVSDATTEVTTPAAPVSQPTVSLAERAAAMSDARLNDMLNSLDFADPEYGVYADEMTVREDRAAVALALEEAAQAEQTSVVEDAPAETEVPQQAEPTVEAEPAPAGIRSVFPVMEDSRFTEAFQLPTDQLTRTIGSENPLTFVQNALNNSASLTALLGQAPTHDLNAGVASAYSAYLNEGKAMATALSRNLTNWLNTRYSKSNPMTRGEMIATNQQFTTTAGNTYNAAQYFPSTLEGRVLNLTEINNGQVQYNNELMEASVLAGLQWQITADQLGSILDTKDAAEILNIPAELVADGLVDELNQGMGAAEAMRSLASKIRSYWGVTANSNAPDGYVEGIPQGMAGELLNVMVETGFLDVLQFDLSVANDVLTITQTNSNGDVLMESNIGVAGIEAMEGFTPRKYNRYVPKSLPELSPIREFPNAIETVVLTTPEDVSYIGSDVEVPVARTQMRNPLVENTQQQLDTIEYAQNTPFFIHEPMLNLYNGLGRDGILRLFGTPDDQTRVLNKNHQQTLDGRNRTLVSALDQLDTVVAEVRNMAGVAGVALNEMPIRYGANASRVSRLQMLGKYSPQASKLVREVIMPTQSTTDLSNENFPEFARFSIAMAQAFGIKVHNLMPDVANAKLKSMLTGGLADVISMLQNRGDAAIDRTQQQMIIDGFRAAGADLTPVGFLAVSEYARLQAATPEERTAFTTPLYLEADGMTNGPMNAMMLFNTGTFTGDQLKTLAKSGLYLTREGDSSSQYRSEVDSQDLYQTATNRLISHLGGLRASLSDQPAAAQQLTNLLEMMDLFLGKDLSFDGSNLTIERGIAKNPLTITVYGSGPAGIAAKMSSAITDAIYERMSQVAQAKANDPSISTAQAMFGPQSENAADADAKMAKFTKALNRLIGTKVVPTRDGFSVTQSPTGRRGNTFDPVNFSFTGAEIANMNSAMHHLFVTPLRASIEDVMGSTLDTADLVRRSTQVQSIALQFAFRREVQKRLDEKKKASDYSVNDGLSQAEYRQILDGLSHLSPIIDTGTQRFFIAGGAATDVGPSEFGRDLSGNFRSPAFVYGPTNAGVSGIPFLNIGAGDAQMMQNIATSPNAPQGTLMVFDGINLPLNEMENGSQVANKAAFDAWMGNPLAAVSESYSSFMKNVDLSNLTRAEILEYTRALFPPKFWEKGVSPEEIRTAMQGIVGELEDSQRSIEARHRVLKRVGLSVDQMAGANAPHVQEGEVNFYGMDESAVAAQLNRMLEQELNQVGEEQRTDYSILNALKNQAEELATGAFYLGSSDLQRVADSLKLKGNQRQVLNQITRTLAADGFELVYGTQRQVADTLIEEGMDIPFSMAPGVSGVTSMGDGMIYLFSPSTETFVHELTHAATFNSVLNVYRGAGSEAARAAVRSNEMLMDQFLNMTDLGQVNPETQRAYQDASEAIRARRLDSTPEGRASALNEFMAWNLSNDYLASLGQRTKVSRLQKIARGVVENIKRMLGITIDQGDTLFSNLLFNSTVLMAEQPSLGTVVSDVATFQNSNFGTSDRLTNLATTYADLMSRYTTSTPVAGNVAPIAAVRDAITLANDVANSFQAHGFSMTAQEAGVFNDIVAALATEAQVDKNSLATAQQLYSHVMKTLSPASFVNDPMAQEKFDVLSGKFLVKVDGAGRSTLLPAFLALATVNDGFRAVLAEMPMPRGERSADRGLDGLLENAGRAAMESLSARVSGTSKSANVAAAIDALQQNIMEQAQKKDAFIDQMASKTGGLIDRTNELVTSGLTQLGESLVATAQEARAAGTNRVAQLALDSAAVVSAVASEQVAQQVSLDVMSAMNRSNAWQPIHDLVNDIVGRTTSNANVYDMIKAVRSAIHRTRQEFREQLPRIMAEKFTRELTPVEWNSLHTSMGKTDLASLTEVMSVDSVLSLVQDDAAIAVQISQIEGRLRTADSRHHLVIKAKAEQLANFMNNGVPGRNLLRNAAAIATLNGERKASNYAVKDDAFIRDVDTLVSLYAVRDLPTDAKTTLAELARDEAEGMNFALSYLRGQRIEESRKSTTARAKLNAYKGFIPGKQQDGVSMLVADTKDAGKLAAQSYQIVGSYENSSLDRYGRNKSYFFAPAAARAGFEQGIMQNVRQSVNGVDATTGYTIGQTAGRITEPALVAQIAANLHNEQGGNLMPIYDEAGKVIAFERALDQSMMERVASDAPLNEMIGVWRGRQVEEGYAEVFNQRLIDNLKAMYDADIAANPKNSAQYVNILASNDKIVADAANLLTPATKEYVKATFGDRFLVRRDMLNDALGYRTASIGDAWTGTSRWSDDTQKTVRNLAISVFGSDAYANLVNTEAKLQRVVTDARVLIVVKSVVVPVVNMMSNVLQLVSRGVPLKSMVTDVPAKVAEVESYVQSRIREIEAGAELRAAAGNQESQRRLRAEIQSIRDSHKRLSIWPLIESGEFSSVSDADMTREEIMLTSGRLQAYIENAVEKLPKPLAYVGRYAMVTKDTALFQGMQKAIEYGDFIAKAVLYDDLVKRKGMTREAALGRVTEEFVNYDRLAGRFRGGLEKNGLLWFYNFKIRSTKVALSMIRNNPVHTLLATAAPVPTLFGSVGLPTEDNMFSKLADGSLDYSIGPGQGLNAPMLNPWVNLTQ